MRLLLTFESETTMSCSEIDQVTPKADVDARGRSAETSSVEWHCRGCSCCDGAAVQLKYVRMRTMLPYSKPCRGRITSPRVSARTPPK